MKILIEESVLRQWKEALEAEQRIIPSIKFEKAIASMQEHLDAAEKVEPVKCTRCAGN